MQEDFEAAFQTEDSDATFNYLKSFRRARVNFTSTEATVAARLKFHQTELCGQCVKCYFAQVCKIHYLNLYTTQPPPPPQPSLSLYPCISSHLLLKSRPICSNPTTTDKLCVPSILLTVFVDFLQCVRSVCVCVCDEGCLPLGSLSVTLPCGSRYCLVVFCTARQALVLCWRFAVCKCFIKIIIIYY